MHPDIAKTIAALRVDDWHAAAAAARLARLARAGRPASLPPPGFAAGAGRRHARRQWLPGRWVRSRPQAHPARQPDWTA